MIQYGEKPIWPGRFFFSSHNSQRSIHSFSAIKSSCCRQQPSFLFLLSWAGEKSHLLFRTTRALRRARPSLALSIHHERTLSLACLWPDRISFLRGRQRFTRTQIVYLKFRWGAGSAAVRKFLSFLAKSQTLQRSLFDLVKKADVDDIYPLPLTCESLRPSFSASFFRSGFEIYFWIWKRFSNPCLWASENTARRIIPLRGLPRFSGFHGVATVDMTGPWWGWWLPVDVRREGGNEWPPRTTISS